MKEKILLTGASGFIGTNLLEDLIGKGYEVLNIDSIEPKIPARKNVWNKVDICDYASFEKAVLDFNPDYIVHLAARTDLDGKTLEDYNANIVGVTKEHNYYLWKYMYYLRKEEYHCNKILKYYYRRKKNILGAKLGVLIYEGTCGKGLRIWHYGNIIINGFSKIGENCTLHGQNCIGNRGDESGVNSGPVIGNNVDIGVGATIIGNVFIANNVRIGAGAVVVKSCYDEGATLVGVPARIISNHEAHEEGKSDE